MREASNTRIQDASDWTTVIIGSPERVGSNSFLAFRISPDWRWPDIQVVSTTRELRDLSTTATKWPSPSSEEHFFGKNRIAWSAYVAFRQDPGFLVPTSSPHTLRLVHMLPLGVSGERYLVHLVLPTSPGCASISKRPPVEKLFSVICCSKYP